MGRRGRRAWAVLDARRGRPVGRGRAGRRPLPRPATGRARAADGAGGSAQVTMKPPLIVAVGNSRRGRTLVIGLSLRDMPDVLVGETAFETFAETAALAADRVMVVAGKDLREIEKTVKKLGV